MHGRRQVDSTSLRAAHLRRRVLLRRGAGLAGAGLAALDGLLAPPAGAAVQRAAANPFVLKFVPWGGWPAYAGPHWRHYIAPAMQRFESQNPGVKVSVQNPLGGNDQIIAAILAGQGPDVFEDWFIAPYVEAGLVVDLLPFVKRDNLSLSIWSPGQIQSYQYGSGLWALPCYPMVGAMAINLSVLDNLGLKYPDPDWDWQQAERLFRAATFTRNGVHQYGLSPYWNGVDFNQGSYPCNYFGGRLQNADKSLGPVDQPASYKGIEWYNHLFWDKVAGGGDISQNATFYEAQSNSIATQLNRWRDKFKWTYWTIPRFPAGRFSFEDHDFYAISSQTKNLEASWAMERFLTADPWWQHYCMRYMLRVPGMVDLWDDWVRVVEQVAPVARGRNLQVFKQAAAEWGLVRPEFPYASSRAIHTLNHGLSAAFNRQQDIATAMRVAAAQVRALEAEGARLSGHGLNVMSGLNAELARAAKVQGSVTLPAPSASGVGLRARPARDALSVRGGAYTLVGTGAGLMTQSWGPNGSDDFFTFACTSWRASRGQVTCRLTAIASVNGVLPQTAARIGLMARSDLASEAPFAAVSVTIGRGIHVQARSLPSDVPADEKPASGSTGAGLIGSAVLLADNSKPAPNYLLKPVWLRLVRSVNVWTAFTSLDGAHWTQAGDATAIEAAGTWVGIFVAPHDPDARHHLQATFDNLSFTPTATYQVGGAASG